MVFIDMKMVDKLSSKVSSLKRVSVDILSTEEMVNKMMDISEPVSANTSVEYPVISEEEGAAAFARVMAQLKTQVGIEAYTSWFGRLKLSEYNRNLVKLSVPTAFLRSWINNHYGSLLTGLWKQENSAILRVEVIVRDMKRVAKNVVCRTNGNPVLPISEKSNASPLVENYTENSARNTQTGVFGSPLDSRYTFDSFVEGASNRVALAAARSVAEGHKSALRFNPLFIHASVGLGKTHLLQAIAAAALKRLTSTRVIYLTAEYFMWRFATAIRDNDALSFKEQLRDIDLLIIDDMQFLQGRSIQYEFCHLLNMLLDSAKQVVVAADRPPAELESLDLRVRSRLQGGVALEIEAPDYEMRLEMLRQRLKIAQQDDNTIAISDDILEYIAKTVLGSGRDIEGAFNQLLFRQSFETDLSLQRVDELLGHLTRSSELRRIRIEEIQRTVARHYNVSKQDLLSNRRTRTIVKPRQVAMYLAKVLTPRSLPEIGRRFGGRDHTTVLHAVRKIEDLVCDDQTLAKELELLKRLIGEQTV
ncbi:chromosomal replication initiator protein dnaA [Bartonella bacilliformis str. Heidi Mejia]|nr:chromosomal replication initiator protein dnaA [Bartonella bacilliformis str. Heidi Mejia]KEG15768.1 chromosomal replication initiator protein dnaA [Bartonella bacilliformis Cond044]KEG17511.1 chromosomal replication initiator protein dnaA [Bartonella bacilliformis Hosp800-02]KEG21896.1 chromosomal replication initiator protein dnaA [Bartonella bacilliformis VAB9028]KEG23271.1 chromosomal replication initiator protein dnaA [Bartonella bacilliformis CAR600-02]